MVKRYTGPWYERNRSLQGEAADSDDALLVPSGVIGSISPAGATSSFDISVRGRIAYLLSNANAMMFAIDVADPASPVLLGSIATDITPRALVAQGDFVYVVGDTGAGRNFQVYDVKNPAAIVKRSGIVSINQSQGIAVQGRLVAAADRGGGLRLIDVSNPSVPLIIAAPNIGFPSQGLAFAGPLLLGADPNTSSLQIWDISNPTTPVVVSTLGTFSSPRAIRVLDRHAFMMVNGDSSIKVINVAAPAAPVLVASIGTVASPNTFDIQGNALYVGGTNGISVHDITNPAAAELAGTIPVAGVVRGVVALGDFLYVSVSTAPYLQIFKINEGYARAIVAGGVDVERLSVRGVATMNDMRLSGGLSVAESLLASSDVGVGRTLTTRGIRTGVITTAVDYAMQPTDQYVGVTDTSIPRTVTLPDSRAGTLVNLLQGMIVTIKDESRLAGTNPITIQRAGIDTVEGGTTFPLNTNGASVLLQLSGTNWNVISKF